MLTPLFNIFYSIIILLDIFHIVKPETEKNYEIFIITIMNKML